MLLGGRTLPSGNLGLSTHRSEHCKDTKTNSAGRSLEVKQSGGTTVSTPQFLNLCILGPQQLDVYSILNCPFLTWELSPSQHLSRSFKKPLKHIIKLTAPGLCCMFKNSGFQSHESCLISFVIRQVLHSREILHGISCQ